MRIKWVEDVACMGRTEIHKEVLKGKINQRDHL
jgi:hypothetical protein